MPKWLSEVEFWIVHEAIEDALAEVRECEDISQGVEDKLENAKGVLDAIEE